MVGKNSYFFSRFVFIPIDFILLLGIFLFGYFFRKQAGIFDSFGYFPEIDQYVTMCIWFVLLYQIILFCMGGYDMFRYFKLSKEIITIILSNCIWISCIASYFFWTRDFFFSRYILILSFVVSIVVLSCIRLLYSYLSKNAFPKKRVYILGSDHTSHVLQKYIQKTGQYQIHVSKETFQNLQDDILIIADIHDQKTIDASIEFALIHHIRVFVYHKDLLRNNIHLDFEGVKMYEIFDTPLHGLQRVIKRIADIIFSIIGIAFLLIIYIPISIGIKLDSKGPIFIGLIRIGRGNQPFTLYKFRSMVNGAQSMKADLLKNNDRSGPLFKMKQDPRITRFGKLLRKTRIDEIPQFWNILKGDMSLVGPRPHEPGEVNRYHSYQKKLLMIKPGLTGKAQVSGASDLEFEEEVDLDMSYIENWSIWSDALIIFKTIGVILTGRGAD